VYAIIPSTAIVAGLDVAPEAVTTGVADVTGQVLAEVTVDPNGVGDPVQLVRNAVAAACRVAQIQTAQLRGGDRNRRHGGSAHRGRARSAGSAR
jgi:hypothetical protein